MALIQCKECGKEISDTVKSCPHCGFRIEKVISDINNTSEIVFLDNYNYNDLKKIINVFLIVTAFLTLILAVIGFNYNSEEEKIAINIIQDLKNDLDYPNSLNVSEIYITKDKKYVMVIYKYVDKKDAVERHLTEVWQNEKGQYRKVGGKNNLSIGINTSPTDVEKIITDIRNSGNSIGLPRNRIMRNIK